jgi:hypothetical protein
MAADEKDLVLTLRLTHFEAGSVYAVLQSVLTLGAFAHLPDQIAALRSVVEKLSAAQTTAIAETVQAEMAKGEPN